MLLRMPLVASGHSRSTLSTRSWLCPLDDALDARRSGLEAPSTADESCVLARHVKHMTTLDPTSKYTRNTYLHNKYAGHSSATLLFTPWKIILGPGCQLTQSHASCSLVAREGSAANPNRSVSVVARSSSPFRLACHERPPAEATQKKNY